MLLVAALALLVGITLGLLGGGGTILTVPVLVYLLAVPAKPAIATSLFVVAATSAASLGIHARSGLVRWRVGLLFGGASMVGAFGGGRLGALLDPTVLLLSFAAMMLATATAMLMKGTSVIKDRKTELSWPKVVAEGLVVGAVTGLVGAGGGFLVVPALVLLGGLTMQEAIGTSLLVIALKSSAGLAGYMGRVDIDWSIALPMAGFAILGSLVGSRLAHKLPQAVLRRVFAGFVLIMGVVMVLAEVW
jgi:uncharacterized membrane protein YfcA